MSRVGLRKLAQDTVKIAAGLKRAQTKAARRERSTECLSIGFPYIPLMADEPRMHRHADGRGCIECAARGRAVSRLTELQDLVGLNVDDSWAFNALEINEKHPGLSNLDGWIERQVRGLHPTCEGFAGGDENCNVLTAGA